MFSRQDDNFWSSAMTRRLKVLGSDALLVSWYLETSPLRNMIGLYYLPESAIAYDLGISPERAHSGLRSTIQAGFSRYDNANEVVWVVDMICRQVATKLKPTDKQVKAVIKRYASAPNNLFLAEFFDRHRQAFHLLDRREYQLSEASPFEAPLKPLASQEQEQEQQSPCQKEELYQDRALRSEDSGDLAGRPNVIPLARGGAA